MSEKVDYLLHSHTENPETQNVCEEVSPQYKIQPIQDFIEDYLNIFHKKEHHEINPDHQICSDWR